MSAMPSASLWRTRVIWALLGAAVTAVPAVTAVIIMGVRERDGDAQAEVVHAELEPVPIAGTLPPAGAGEAAASDGSRGAGSTSEAGTSDAGTSDVGTSDASTSDVSASTSDASASTSEVGASEVAPAAAGAVEIPLPMLPGTRVMNRSQRHDEERGSEILTLALSVPAPGSQVEAFYRRALTDAKLVVTGTSSAPASLSAGHSNSLHGRGREATVDVNIKQPAGKLRTIVRIIWRTRS